MKLDQHKKTLGILHLVYGIFTALVFLFIGSIANIFIPFIQEAIIEDEGIESEKYVIMVAEIIRVAFLILFIFSALPSILGGLGLIMKLRWGLIVSMIAGCVSLLNFPFGTALGIYTIYVFVLNNNEKNEQLVE